VKKFTFYEQVGIVIPGAVLLFGLTYQLPQLRDLLSKDGISVGGLGVFVLLAYAAGHLVAAFGNAIEAVLWWWHGGMPSDWVTKPPPNILSKEQLDNLVSRVQSRLGVDIKSFAEIDRRAWWPVARQVYGDVMKNGKPQRIDTFNGNYGLNRGLCASTLALAVVFILAKDWAAGFGLLAVSTVYLYRARRFGIHYARELYVQFLLLPTYRSAQKEKRKRATGAKTKSTEASE
jgi:hypothetical protein